MKLTHLCLIAFVSAPSLAFSEEGVAILSTVNGPNLEKQKPYAVPAYGANGKVILWMAGKSPEATEAETPEVAPIQTKISSAEHQVVGAGGPTVVATTAASSSSDANIESSESSKVLELQSPPTDRRQVLTGRTEVVATDATLREIVEKVMPEGWRVIEDYPLKNIALESAKFNFRATSSRQLMLMSLKKEVYSSHGTELLIKIFWTAEVDGRPAPYVILTTEA